MADRSPSGTHPRLSVFTGHVLHVVDTSVFAAWGPMLRQAIWMLRESGVATSLVTDDDDLLAGLDGTDVRGLRVDAVSGWRAWQLPGRLARELDPPPAIVHLWGTPGLSWVRRWANPRGVPRVIHVLGATHAERLARRGVPHDEIVAAVAQPLVDAVASRFPTAARWARVSPAAALPLLPTSVRDAGRTCGVLCVSSLDDQEGVEVFLSALAQLRAQAADFQAVLVGNGRGGGDVWRAIRSHGVQGVCVVLDDPKLWEQGLPGADICVVPGVQRDPWLAPLLAMGLGKLVIASREQPAEWFIDEQTAWQFTPGSAVELAYLLGRALGQPKLVQRTSMTASEYFHEHHAVGDLVLRLMSLYQAAVDAEGAAPVQETSSERSDT